MENQQLDHRSHLPKDRKFPLVILAHDLDVPMNLGSLFRLSDALGVERLYLTGTTPLPPNGKISKTSRSTEKYVPYEHHADPGPLVQALKAQGTTIVSLELTNQSRDIREVDFTAFARICLIVGAESVGVSPALLAASDLTVHIPMLGVNSSMNVATAAAIALFEIIRSWRL
jgi:tRNA G18 (ribose-2'-O)-methylase SpoU